MPDTYALELKLTGRRCVVVGGGSVAARKVRTLARAGAEVHVVAPRIDAAICATANVQRHEQSYAADVLGGATLVFACTNDAVVNRQVAQDARAVGAWVNVADDPGRCDFFVPASFERGEFRVTVSTGGAGPQLAANVRRKLESLFGPEYGTLADELRRARTIVLEGISDPQIRRDIFETLCGDASIQLLGSQGVTAWREWFERVVRSHQAHP
jgi:precorrin-2 dehydrogenase/sirohydrochlorin ferrochelatase